MSDAFNFDPSLTGSAGEFGGQVGGYNIGAQPEPTFTTPATPAQSFTPTETGYTPTFDFSQMFQGALPDYGMPQAQPTRYAGLTSGVNVGPRPIDIGAAPMQYAENVTPAGTQSRPVLTPELQSLFQQAGQPLPSIVKQFVGPQGADATSGLYDTSGISGAPTAPQQDKAGFLQSLLGKGFSVGDALKLALGIGGGIMGYNNQQKAASDTAAAEAEYKAAAQNAASQYQTLAQPYLTAGGSQLSMALQGSLAPAQMQQFQAAQAQLAQGAERTGGVGAIQSTAALQNIYQQALQNQQNMALQLLGPGNTLASNAIATELQGTQGGLKLGLDLATQANQASMNMYSAIAQMMGGQKPSTQTATS